MTTSACPSCGSATEPGWKACPRCGKSLDGKRARLPWWAAACVFIVVLAGVSGFFHFVYNASGGFKVITKESWALHDTVVDWGDFQDKPIILLVHDHAPLLRRLIQEGAIERPAFLDRASSDEP
jgi:hypothetical protein